MGGRIGRVKLAGEATKSDLLKNTEADGGRESDGGTFAA